MLYKCVRSGGTTLWSVADTQIRRGVGNRELGKIGEGKVCIVLDASDGPLDLGIVSYFKIFFDGQVGYVVSHSLKHIDDWTSDAL